MFLCLRIIFNDHSFGYFHLLAPLTSSPAPCTPPAPPASPPRAPPTAHPTCTPSQHILATTEAKPTCQTHRRASDFKWSQELDHWIWVHRHSLEAEVPIRSLTSKLGSDRAPGRITWEQQAAANTPPSSDTCTSPFREEQHLASGAEGEHSFLFQIQALFLSDPGPIKVWKYQSTHVSNWLTN